MGYVLETLSLSKIRPLPPAFYTQKEKKFFSCSKFRTGCPWFVGPGRNTDVRTQKISPNKLIIEPRFDWEKCNSTALVLQPWGTDRICRVIIGVNYNFVIKRYHNFGGLWFLFEQNVWPNKFKITCAVIDHQRCGLLNKPGERRRRRRCPGTTRGEGTP